MNEELKLKKMEFLQATLHKCLMNEPKLDLQEIAMILSGEIGLEALPEFLKLYKKEDKKW